MWNKPHSLCVASQCECVCQHVSVCVCVCAGVRVYRDGHILRGHFSIGTIGPRESVLCSQRSSDVIRVQSPWECVKYRDKGKNNRGPRRVWSFTNVCTGIECGVLATIEQWYPTREIL